MNYGKVYLEAAEKIASSKKFFSCLAVDDVAGQKDSQESRFYRRFMYPRGDEYRFCAAIERECGKDRETNEAFRVLLLCMAAACWRDMLPLLEGK